MFTLTIRTENEAFEDVFTPEGEMGNPAEVCRILRRAADKLEHGEQEGRLMDCNGNAVGSYELKPD